VFTTADVVHTDVAVLTRGEHVLLARIHLHVVQRRLASYVVTSGKLGWVTLRQQFNAISVTIGIKENIAEIEL
jgi:hypothetical protein